MFLFLQARRFHWNHCMLCIFKLSGRSLYRLNFFYLITLLFSKLSLRIWNSMTLETICFFLFLFISDTLHPTFPQAVTLHLIIIFLQQDKPLVFLVKKLTFTLNVLELFWQLPSKRITSFNYISFQFLFNFSSPIWPIKVMFSLTRLIFFHNFLIKTYSPSRYMWNATCFLFRRNCFFLYLKYYTGILWYCDVNL